MWVEMKPSANSKLMNLIANEFRDSGRISRAVVSQASESISAERQKAYVGPRTETEKALAGIWADVMRVKTVGVEDGFLDLGGHSLSATQITSRVRANFRVEIPLPLWFENPTVAMLAVEIEQALKSEMANPSAAEPWQQIARLTDR
jgi:acyl carrier protein